MTSSLFVYTGMITINIFAVVVAYNRNDDEAFKTSMFLLLWIVIFSIYINVIFSLGSSTKCEAWKISHLAHKYLGHVGNADHMDEVTSLMVEKYLTQLL